MFGQGGGPDGKARRVLPAVDAVLAEGEQRRAATVVRGLGRGADVGRAIDWVLAATDRRVLLFTLPPGPGATPTLVSSFARDGVLVIDAQLTGPSPTLVVRLPDTAEAVDATASVVAWFHPLGAWREETRRLVEELGRVVPYPDERAHGSRDNIADAPQERRSRDDFRS
jgi:hypothetical protein